MKLTGKIASIAMYVLLFISVLFSMLVFIGPAGGDGTPEYVDSVINWAFVMIFGTVAITLLFEIFHIIMHPANAKRTLLSALGIILVLVLSWYMADGTPLKIIGYEGSDNVPTMLKITDTGLYTFYLLFGVSFFGIIASEFSRVFK